jgi:predicted transcriptional regulator of viral defense system
MAQSNRDVLVSKLRELGNSTFDIARLAHLAGSRSPTHAHLLAHRLVKSGHLVRRAKGLYGLPERPLGLGALIRWKAAADHVQLSHRSAMAAHGFGSPLPHRSLQVSVDATRRDTALSDGISLSFVKRSADEFGPAVELDLPGLGPTPVTNPERTLLDALASPVRCGGFLDACRFVASRRGQWNAAQLLDEARRTPALSVPRRAGCCWSGRGTRPPRASPRCSPRTSRPSPPSTRMARGSESSSGAGGCASTSPPRW